MMERHYRAAAHVCLLQNYITLLPLLQQIKKKKELKKEDTFHTLTFTTIPKSSLHYDVTNPKSDAVQIHLDLIHLQQYYDKEKLK